jgi:7-carboxy-7-deazaguanine synthase
MSRLRISEIFSSVQGEGGWLGTPSTFVRLSGCNLRCTWCDTPYASWEPEGPVRSISEIIEQVVELSNQHVVITGGEPMLFEPVVELTKRLSGLGKIITIETAGTVSQPIRCHLMSISPKLSHSTPTKEKAGDWAERHEKDRLNIEVLTNLIENYDTQLKFVVNPEGEHDDIKEIEDLLAKLPHVESDQVMLMAEGTDREVLARREPMLLEVCMARGWRLTPRFHISLFGDRRGT